jgi:hypothetical protein
MSVRLAAWESVARRLGLALTVPGPGELWPGSRLSGTIEHIQIDCHLDGRHLPTPAGAELGYTLIDARSTPAPPTLWFSVVDGELDRAGGAREELVPLWLSPEVMTEIHAAPDWSFSLVEGLVHAALRRPESSSDALVAAIRAVVRLARRPFEIDDDLDGLAQRLGGKRAPYLAWDPDVRQPIVVDAGGIEVEIEHRFGRFGNRWRADRAAYTRLSCARGAAGVHRFVLVERNLAPSFGGRGRKLRIGDPHLDARYLAIAEDAEHLTEHLTPEVRTLLATLAPAAAVVDDRVGIWVPGLVLTPEPLAALVRLCVALAPERVVMGGPYR